MFALNGTVGDAAVATMLCVCVVMPHRCGLGGGFVATYYNRKTRNATAVLAMARAPGSSSPEMYRDNANASLYGARSVAAFGELKGYELLLNVAGSRVTWRTLFEDAITLAERGVRVYGQLADDIAVVARDPDSSARSEEAEEVASPKARKHLTNPLTTHVLKEGDWLYNQKFAETLRRIANSPKRGRFLDAGPDIEALVEELKDRGGVLTVKDFASFKLTATVPLSVMLSEGPQLFTTPAPSSGAVLAFVMLVMDSFRQKHQLPDNELSAHFLVEALKFGYARRFKLGDPDIPDVKESLNKALNHLLRTSVSESVVRSWIGEKAHQEAGYYGLQRSSAGDYGSGQMCVVGPEGDALCLVSSLNMPFGARLRSEATGVWCNNHMNAFSTPSVESDRTVPPSENNYIRAGFRPASSFAPAIVVDAAGDVVLAVCATGGQLIVSALVQVMVRGLWMRHTMKQAIDAGRLHNQLYPDNVVWHENNTDKDVLAGLVWRDHKLALSAWPGAVVGIKRRSEGVFEACHDYRDGAIASSSGGRPG
ncbi:scoloptoxin SSD14-like [Amblyomma americanum]